MFLIVQHMKKSKDYPIIHNHTMCIWTRKSSWINWLSREFDWVKLTGIATDGGAISKIWRNDEDIRKIIPEIKLSYVRIRKTIYLINGTPDW